jgi:hypothetical protein
MTKPIAYYFDSPTVQAMSEEYGAYFEDLSESDRSCLMYLLVDAVNDILYADVEEVSIDQERFVWDDESIALFIPQLDTDISSPQEALNLIMGLAQSIERTLQDA